MDNNIIHIIAYVLHEQNYQRNFLRLERRRLRDSQNPFDIPDEMFICYYRLNRDIVRGIIETLEPHAIRIPGNANAKGIPFALKVFAVLSFYANGSYQVPIGNSSWSNISQTSVSRSITEVTNLIVRNYMADKIKFPITMQEKNNVKRGFNNKWRMPGIIGVIDGTHVEIVAPPSTDLDNPPFLFINRKGRHSINVMLISDSDSRILAVNARFPGSVHDSAIWNMSNIRNHVQNQYEEGDRTSFLIGDSGYGLEPWLLTPFNHVEDGTPEAEYNVLLKRTRNVIERTNGILKGRFRCLSKERVLRYHPIKAAQIINACFILHNIALDNRLPVIDIEGGNLEEAADDIGVLQPNELLGVARAARANYIAQNIR